MSFVSTALLALAAGVAANGAEYYGYGPEKVSSAPVAPAYSTTVAPPAYQSTTVAPPAYYSAESSEVKSVVSSIPAPPVYYSSSAPAPPVYSSTPVPPPVYYSSSASSEIKSVTTSSIPAPPVYYSSSATSSEEKKSTSSSVSSGDVKSVSSSVRSYPISKSSAPDVYITEVVTAITTYCPSATTLTHGGNTYTVTKPTTLTITSCSGGCKVSKPVKSLPPSAIVTVVVPTYTTVCPSPTTVTIQSKTYTVSKSTTITVTSCPGGCTITTPVSLLPPVTTAYPSSGFVASSSGYFPYVPKASSSGSAPAQSSPSTYQGGAAKVGGSAALLLGALGLLAL